MLPTSTENFYQLLRLLARKRAILIGERSSTPKSWEIRPNYDFNGDWDGCDSIGSICIQLLDVYQANPLSIEEKWLFKDLMLAIEDLALSQKKDLTWLKSELEAVEVSRHVAAEKTLSQKTWIIPVITSILVGVFIPIAGILNWWFLDQPTSRSDRSSNNKLEELRREISTSKEAGGSEKPEKTAVPLEKIQPWRCVESEGD